MALVYRDVKVECPDCYGEGVVSIPTTCHHQTIDSANRCGRCGGSDLMEADCDTCGGSGVVWGEEVEEEDL